MKILELARSMDPKLGKSLNDPKTKRRKLDKETYEQDNECEPEKQITFRVISAIEKCIVKPDDVATGL